MMLLICTSIVQLRSDLDTVDTGFISVLCNWVWDLYFSPLICLREELLKNLLNKVQFFFGSKACLKHLCPPVSLFSETLLCISSFFFLVENSLAVKWSLVGKQHCLNWQCCLRFVKLQS